jgi:hypothetical protein
MNWHMMRSPFEDMRMWGAESGPHNFIITEDDGIYSAGVNMGEVRIVNWFDAFGTLKEAKETCELWLKEHTL